MAAPMSDITGYRSDGGALGQDQGLTKNLKGILTAKAPLLSAPGTVLENTLYYDINSSSVTAVEMQATFAKDRIVLNNLQAGSSPSAYIPSVLFAGTVFWEIQLNSKAKWPAVDPVLGTTVNNLAMPSGWGFSALKQIIVYMGASTIAQIPISAMTNFLVNAACCETLTKRRLMIQRAGEYLNWHDPRSKLAPPANNDSIWREKAISGYSPAGAGQPSEYNASYLAHASVPLRLPFASMSVLDKRLSFDTKLTTQPIQITLETRPFSEFTVFGANTAAAIGTMYEDSSIQLWQEELSDKSLSVRNELLAMPEFNVSMPFQYAQSIPFDVPSQGDNGNTSDDFKMNITSIINSDLTTFLFNVTWNARTDPKGGQLCPLYGEQLLGIELLLNGQRFFNFDQLCYEGVILAKQIDDARAPVILPSYNDTIGTAAQLYPGFEAMSYYYEFNNSRLRAIVGEDNLQNTARFTNQTFQLNFRINRDLFYLLPAPVEGDATTYTYSVGFPKNKGYTLNMTYLYNAVFLIGGDGGTTKLITN